MKTRSTIKWLTLVFAAIALLFAGYWGHRILQAAYPEQGMLITAQPGTTIRVDPDLLVVQGGTASFTSFSGSIKPLIQAVYLAAAALSLVGVWSLFRETKNERHRPKI